ncbi:hypothetical protein ONO57_26950, partial [Salmonella enterica subsp. enterica serovar Anatum]|nr:hypothetical protein [Salmonella enterica subsp. enterica serovar Anatum]
CPSVRAFPDGFKRSAGNISNNVITNRVAKIACHEKCVSIQLPVRTQVTDVQTVSFVGMIIDRKVLNNHLNDIHDELFLYYDDF